MSTPVSSVLLLGADYYGTLAAARCFGRRGVRVVVADDHRRARTLFSKYVAERLLHPPLQEPDALVQWLVEWGTDHPGTLLYPPNDHFAWLFALYRDRLSQVFAMLSPAEDVVYKLLDKYFLHQLCSSSQVGIKVPVTLIGSDQLTGTTSLAPIGFPVLLKPRTQVFLQGGTKGILVHDASELSVALERYRREVSYHAVLTSRHPDVMQPMIQQYFPSAETNIVSLSGFMSPTGELVTRAATKVLQRPRKVGIGLCFEGREPSVELTEKIGALCRTAGYVGAFEAEFITHGDDHLMIDFNPRFYSQMGFDIARGVSIPMLVLWSATNRHEELAAEMAHAQAWRGTGKEAYCHKTMFDLVLALQRASGRMRPQEVRAWKSWFSSREGSMVDAVRDSADPLPAAVDTAAWLRHFASHPRSFVRNFVLNR